MLSRVFGRQFIYDIHCFVGLWFDFWPRQKQAVHKTVNEVFIVATLNTQFVAITDNFLKIKCIQKNNEYFLSMENPALDGAMCGY